MTPGTRRIPDALLERYLADALQAEAKARLELMLAGSPEDQARLAELRADSAAFLLQHPPRAVVDRFQQERWWTRGWPWFALLVPVLAAAVLFLVRPGTSNPYTPKGSVILVIYRTEPDGSLVPVSPHVPLAPGSELQFRVKAAASGFVAVVSKDAKGVITVYSPYSGTAARAYDPRKPRLPERITLDDTLGREDVYALYSSQSFELEWALEALKQGQPLEEAAPAGVSVGASSFTKQK